MGDESLGNDLNGQFGSSMHAVGLLLGEGNPLGALVGAMSPKTLAPTGFWLVWLLRQQPHCLERPTIQRDYSPLEPCALDVAIGCLII